MPNEIRDIEEQWRYGDVKPFQLNRLPEKKNTPNTNETNVQNVIVKMSERNKTKRKQEREKKRKKKNKPSALQGFHSH